MRLKNFIRGRCHGNDHSRQNQTARTTKKHCHMSTLPSEKIQVYPVQFLAQLTVESCLWQDARCRMALQLSIAVLQDGPMWWRCSCKVCPSPSPRAVLFLLRARVWPVEDAYVVNALDMPLFQFLSAPCRASAARRRPQSLPFLELVLVHPAFASQPMHELANLRPMVCEWKKGLVLWGIWGWNFLPNYVWIVMNHEIIRIPISNNQYFMERNVNNRGLYKELTPAFAQVLS